MRMSCVFQRNFLIIASKGTVAMLALHAPFVPWNGVLKYAAVYKAPLIFVDRYAWE